MTGAERLLRVLKCEDADRIPVSPFIYINTVRKFYDDTDVDHVAKTPEVYRELGFEDILHRNIFPAWRELPPTQENWEVALYPVENHGFRQPSSWYDEYRRILKLFEENLKD